MRTRKKIMVCAVAASAAFVQLGLAGAGTAAASGSLPSAQPAVSAASGRGWHQLLKIRDANLYSLAVAGQNAWAGGYRDAGGLHPLVEHFTGAAWHPVTLPARVDPTSGGIDLMAASSPRNLWIFITHAGKLLAARWNGRHWQTRTPPSGQTLDQAAVTFGASNTWDFGQFAVAHFTASGWQLSSFPVDVTSVSAVSSSDIWAYGPGSSISSPSIAAHWNGRRWTYLSVPLAINPKGLTRLTPGGIHVFSASDVWVDGTAWSPKNQTAGAAVVMHWNGHVWQRAYASPAGPFASLTLMTADGRGDLWMASEFVPGLLHEHHGRFTSVPGPKLPHAEFETTALTWQPGTRTLLMTGFLTSETTVEYGHVESYTY